MSASRQLESHLPHVLNNLALCAVSWRDHEAAERYAGEGLAYTDGHDLDLWRLSILGTHVRSLLDQGRWTEALEAAARDPVRRDEPRRGRGGRRWPSWPPCAPVAAIPRRRGPSPRPRRHTPASPAWEAQIASTHAEVAWLDGRAGDIDALTAACARARRRRRVAVAVRRARAVAASRRPRRSRRPRPARADRARARRAAMPRRRRPGSELGCPYEAAVALCLADDEDAITEAHGRLRDDGCRQRRRRSRPGAFASAASAASPRGPRRATRSNPAQLTPRELDGARPRRRRASRTPRSPSGCSSRRAPSTTTSRRSCGSSTPARGARPSPPAAAWASSNPGSASAANPVVLPMCGPRAAALPSMNINRRRRGTWTPT